jgi:hypothetical protein
VLCSSTGRATCVTAVSRTNATGEWSQPHCRCPHSLEPRLPRTRHRRVARAWRRNRRRSSCPCLTHRVGAHQLDRRLHLAGFRTPQERFIQAPPAPLQPQTSDLISFSVQILTFGVVTPIWHNGSKSGERKCGPGTFLPSETFSGSGGHARNDGVPNNPNHVPNN